MDEKMITITIGDINKVLTKLSRPEYKIEQPVYSWCNADVYAILSTVLDQGFEVWRLTFYHMVLYNDQVGGREMFHIQRTIQTGPPGTQIPLSFEIRIHKMYKYHDWVTPNHFIANNDGIVKITKSDADIMSIIDAVRPKADIDSGKLSSILLILMQIADEQDTVKEEIPDMNFTFQSINNFFKTVFNPRKIENDIKYSYELDSQHYHLYAVYSYQRFFDIKILDRVSDPENDVYTEHIVIQQEPDGTVTIDTPYMESCMNGITHKHQFICKNNDSIKTTFMRIEKDFSGYGTNIYADEVINLLSAICSDESKETKPVKKKLGDCTLNELHDYCAKQGGCSRCNLTHTIYYDDDEHDVCVITNDTCFRVDEIGYLDKEIELK